MERFWLRYLLAVSFAACSVSVGRGEGAAPAPLLVPAETRPIETSQQARPASGSAGNPAAKVSARWVGSETRRIRDSNGWQPRETILASASSGVELNAPARPAAPVIRAGGIGAAGRLGSYVRPAAQQTPADPFTDPFGDKAKESASPTIVPPAKTNKPEAKAEDKEPPRGQDERSDSPKPAPGMDAPIAPAPPRASSPPAALPEQPRLGAEAGERRYNGRDCNEEMDHCDAARKHVKNRPITDISLDITPLFTLAKLDGDAKADYEQRLETELAKAPIRVLRDRRGAVVAEGRLADYRNGRVWIVGTDGTTTKVPFQDLSDDDMCFVASWWSIPTECALGDEAFEPRIWLAQSLNWKASGVCHKPLYFEEVQLERYGHSAGPIVQPLLSGAHFFLNVAALPYQIGIHPPHECQYPLGYYRPGSCAPWLVPPIPVSVRGGLLAAGVYTGGVFVIP